MISFHCIGQTPNTFSILNSVPFGIDDEIRTRDGSLVFAKYDGTQWVGELETKGLSYAKGYEVFFSGTAGSVIRQSGEAQLPLENVVLSQGWNWIGHAPFENYDINSGITVVSGQFNANDQIKTRSGNNLLFSNYDGSRFQGGLSQLKPGVGYEVHVAQAVTFQYNTSTSSSDSPQGNGCTAHFVNSGNLSEFDDTVARLHDTATMLATVMLNGDQIGYPIDGTTHTTTCDQIAAIGVADGLVRGTSDIISKGFAVSILGTAEDLIAFKYWNGLLQQEYDVHFSYTMVAGGMVGSFASPQELTLNHSHFED